MPIGNIGLGMMQGFSDYVTSERERQRKAEDDELNYQRELIRTLASRPDANPALLGKALTDLATIGQAKTNSKLKGGMGGFMGAHELPVSQFLAGFSDGSRPIMGNTQENVPTGSQGMAGMYEPPVHGITELGIAAPPPSIQHPNLPSIRSEMRPVAAERQPYFKSPEAMAQEEGYLAGTKAEATLTGQMNARLSALDKLPQGTLSDRDRQDWIRRNILNLPVSSAGMRTEDYIDSATGQTITVKVDAQGYMTDLQDNPVHLDPMRFRKIGIGPQDRQSFITNDAGNVTVAHSNPYSGETTFTPAPGVQGRTSPEGPVAVYTDPNTGVPSAVRFPRHGTQATPATVGPTRPTTGTPQTQPQTAPPSTNGVTLKAPGGATKTYPPEQATPEFIAHAQSMGFQVVGQTPTVGTPAGAAHPAIKLNADQQKTVDAINQAQPMIDRTLEALGDTPNNSLGSRLHGIGQRIQYGAGFNPSDPVYRELIPLVSFLRVFNTQPYLRGIRNMMYVRQIQDHMPSPTDTPDLIRDKIHVIQENMDGIMKELGMNIPNRARSAVIPTPPVR